MRIQSYQKKEDNNFEKEFFKLMNNAFFEKNYEKKSENIKVSNL